jgi:hypothetical protein
MYREIAKKFVTDLDNKKTNSIRKNQQIVAHLAPDYMTKMIYIQNILSKAVFLSYNGVIIYIRHKIVFK